MRSIPDRGDLVSTTRGGPRDVSGFGMQAPSQPQEMADIYSFLFAQLGMNFTQ
jgi:hypothetical protein